MKACHYLSKSRHGIFYFRYSIPNSISNKRSDVRISLRTRCPNKAKAFSHLIGSYCDFLKLSGRLFTMDISEIRELIADFFMDAELHKFDDIRRNGWSYDVKKTYRQAVRHIKRDIEVGNEKADDLFTPVDNFKQRCGISSKDWEQHKEAILPEIRQRSLQAFEKAIEFGDQFNENRVREALGAKIHIYLSQEPVQGAQEASETLSESIELFINERSKLRDQPRLIGPVSMLVDDRPHV